MPIKPENKSRYPKNWKEIRERILKRANNRCEFCGVENHTYRHNPKTGNDCSKMVAKYLSDYKDKVLYTQSKDVTDVSSHMVLYNYERAVVLTGLMTDRPYTANLVSYTMTFYPNFSLFSTKSDWSHPIRNALFPDILRHRQQTHASLNKVQSPTLDHFLHFEFPPYK